MRHEIDATERVFHYGWLLYALGRYIKSPYAHFDPSFTGYVDKQYLKMSDDHNAKVISSAPVLRKQTEYFLVGQPAISISGSKLPTARAVLRYFFYIKQQCPDRLEAFKKTVDNVLCFWAMARIPAMLPRNCVRKLEALWHEWSELSKSKGRGKDANDRREQFSARMDKLWDIGAKNAIDEIMSSRLLGEKEKEEDVTFYLDQRADRIGTMSGNDKNFAERVEQHQWRNQRAQRMTKSESAASRPSTSQSPITATDDTSECITCDSSEDDPHASDASDPASYQPPDKRQKRADTVDLALPRDIMTSPAILDAADRFGMSSNQVNHCNHPESALIFSIVSNHL